MTVFIYQVLSPGFQKLRVLFFFQKKNARIMKLQFSGTEPFNKLKKCCFIHL